MEMQLILTSLIVLFGLTHGQANGETDNSKVQENFRTLLNSLSENDMKKTEAYRSILEREAVEEQQAFDTMKGDLQSARLRNVYKQKSVESVNGDSFGEKDTLVKREVDSSNDAQVVSSPDGASVPPADNTNQTTSDKPDDKYQGIPKDLWELGYYTFGMAFNKMRFELATVYPKYGMAKGYWCLTNGLEKHFSLPEDLSESISLFNDIEVQHRDFHFDRVKYRAARKIPSYFYTMVAFLTRYDQPDYSRCLSDEDIETARKLRPAVLQHYGLTEESEDEAKNWAAERFASAYSRIRHGVSDLKATYYNAIRANEFLPLRLYELGILQAWNFSIDDLKIVNMMRAFLNPNAPYEYLPRSYDLDIVNKRGEHVPITVILPHIIWSSMHH